MQFIITEIQQFSIEAENKEDALSLRARGEGEAVFSQIVVNPKPTPKESKPIPESEWPIWAKALKQFSTPNDKGIGDVVARMIGDENSMKFKQWHLATFGRPCDCTGRRERWNKQYPL